IQIGRRSKEERMRKPLVPEDAEAIKEECPSVQTVATELFVWGPNPSIKYKNSEILDGNFIGATSQDFAAVNDELADGHFFTDIDYLQRSNAAVIGAHVS